MSSPLRIELRPAPGIGAVLLGLAALAVAALWLSSLPAWSAAAVPVLLALAWPRAARQDARALLLRDDGSAVLLAADGGEIEAAAVRLQRRGWLTVLTLEVQGRMRVHLFTPASLDAEAARSLYLWFERHTQPARPDAVVPGV